MSIGICRATRTSTGAGLDPAVVPGALHAALTVLERWGTMTFEEVAAPAIEYAEHGFPIRESTVRAIQGQQKFFESWPDNQKYWSKPDGSQYKAGETIKLPALARTLKRMVEAERAAKPKRRAAGVAAARDRFYKGDVARDMVAFLQKHDAPFDRSDFADYFARIEEPARTTYRGYTVYKHAFGSQGPMLLQTLNILENFDLRAMGYAQRRLPPHAGRGAEARVCRPRQLLRRSGVREGARRGAVVESVCEGTRGAHRSEARVEVVRRRRSDEVRLAGEGVDVLEGRRQGRHDRNGSVRLARMASLGQDSAGVMKDTTHITVIDKEGNIFDVTPSGGWINGAVILGDTGIGMSVRGEQFWLDKTRANQLRPRARPRYTLTPSIVFKDDVPMMGIGTPGGDNQEQTILQAFLSIVEFWDAWYPNLHGALERPRVQTLHFYGSFWPHTPGFNKLNVEETIPEDVYNELRARGHDASRLRPFGMSGCATVVMIDPATSNRIAGADPRRDCYAMAY